MEPTQNGQSELMIGDEWRRWIAENIILGAAPESIFSTLMSEGMSEDEVMSELNKALESPYIAGAQRLRSRLDKHDWILDIYRKLNRLLPKSGAIERRHKLSRQEFLCEYYTTNRPVIITGMMDDWPALTKWNCNYFQQNFGDHDVQVQFGRNSHANYEIEKEKLLRTMKFYDYVELIKTSGTTNDFYMTAYNDSHNKYAISELWEDILQVPEYLDNSNGEGGFFWFGPQGTKTPFHHDLTNNFMAQVIGRKLLRIASACETNNMYNHLHCFSMIDGSNIDFNHFPMARDAQITEFILNPGEILFLPVGCWHYVEALDVSVTIAFTNFIWDNDFSSFYTTYDTV